MTSSDDANRPRWRGQPGFFEIWFLVVFDPSHGRAWWFRYTTFAPAAGRPDDTRATVWAAAFQHDAPALALKSVRPISAFAAGGEKAFSIRIGPSVLSNGVCRGEVDSAAHRIAWDLRFDPARSVVRRGPWLLDRLPVPTHVAHANSEVAFTGWVEVDGRRVALDGAPGLQKHIWGTRRVEELLWLYAPTFVGAPGCLELTQARLRRRSRLPVTSVWARVGGKALPFWGIRAAPGTRITTPAPGRLEFHAATATRGVRGSASCDLDTLAGYVYRDPAGMDLYVAQSDVASCELERLARAHPLARWRVDERLHATHAVALEFHGAEPLPGVRYLPW